MTENQIVNELGAGFLLFVSFCFQQAAFAKFLKENLACSNVSNVSGCRDQLKTEGKTGKDDWWEDQEEAGHLKAILDIKRYP